MDGGAVAGGLVDECAFGGLLWFACLLALICLLICRRLPHMLVCWLALLAYQGKDRTAAHLHACSV